MAKLRKHYQERKWDKTLTDRSVCDSWDRKDATRLTRNLDEVDCMRCRKTSAFNHGASGAMSDAAKAARDDGRVVHYAPNMKRSYTYGSPREAMDPPAPYCGVENDTFYFPADESPYNYEGHITCEACIRRIKQDKAGAQVQRETLAEYKRLETQEVMNLLTTDLEALEVVTDVFLHDRNRRYGLISIPTEWDVQQGEVTEEQRNSRIRISERIQNILTSVLNEQERVLEKRDKEARDNVR